MSRTTARLRPLFQLLLLLLTSLTISTYPALAGDAPFLLEDINPGNVPVPCNFVCPEVPGSLPSQLTAVGNRSYFVAWEPAHGSELWRTDGTAVGTQRVTDLCPGPCNSSPLLLGELGGNLYFWALSATPGYQIYKLTPDGQLAAVSMAANLEPDPHPSDDEWGWVGFRKDGNLGGFNHGGLLYFVAWEGNEAGLWRTDGTREGSRLAQGVCSLGSSCLPDLRAAANLGPTWLAQVGRQIYRLPVTGPGSGLVATEAELLGASGDRGIYLDYSVGGVNPAGPGPFAYRVGGSGAPVLLKSLWKTGLGPPIGIQKRSAGVQVGSRLYWVTAGTDPRSAQLLSIWESDGTTGGTREVVNGLPVNSVRGLAPLGSSLGYVVAGSGLVRYRPNTGTTEVEVPGNFGSLSGLADGRLVLDRRTDDSSARSESFVLTDGVVEEEIPIPSSPGDPTRIRSVAAVGNGVLFASVNEEFGDEPWFLPITAGSEEPVPLPPVGPSFISSAVPGFRFWVRITAGGVVAPVRQEANCLGETLCVSGAVPGRTEVLLRVVGPRPNGKLWPTIVRFTTAQVEVWIEQIGRTGFRYYKLDAPGADEDTLNGLFDRNGFTP